LGFELGFVGAAVGASAGSGRGRSWLAETIFPFRAVAFMAAGIADSRQPNRIKGVVAIAAAQ
jgi:hypothetical protein